MFRPIQFFLPILIFATFAAHADDKLKALPVLVEPSTQELTAPPIVAAPDLISRDYRVQYTHNIYGIYSLIDTWLPSKLGLSYAYNTSATGSWEVEYLSGSYAPLGIKELGEFSETRVSLLYRSFSERNSFNFIYGLNYNSFKLGIGDKLLSTITGGIVPGYDVVTVETLGLSWGVGNRWNLNDKFLISFDWFAIHIPIYVIESEAPFLEATASEEDKDDIRDALDFIENIPTFSVIKVQFGYNF
jgi:hypothetical protein